MEGKSWNPWTVKCLDEFLFYCCPECDIKDQNRSIFLNHILNEHPISKKYFCDSIKIENGNDLHCQDSIISHDKISVSEKNKNKNSAVGSIDYLDTIKSEYVFN